MILSFAKDEPLSPVPEMCIGRNSAIVSLAAEEEFECSHNQIRVHEYVFTHCTTAPVASLPFLDAEEPTETPQPRFLSIARSRKQSEDTRIKNVLPDDPLRWIEIELSEVDVKANEPFDISPTLRDAIELISTRAQSES